MNARRVRTLLARRTGALAPLLGLALGACGSEGGGSTAAAAVAVDSCAALAAARPGELLGEPVSEPTSFFDVDNDEVSVSQCAVFAQDTGRQVTLLLRYSSRGGAPRSREEAIGGAASADALGMGAETAAAMRAGQELAGLGDLAFSYELLGLNVMAYWDDHYQLTVTAANFESDAAALELARTVAERVIASL